MNLERISWIGSLVLGVSILPALYFLAAPRDDSFHSTMTLPHQTLSSPHLEINLPLRADLSQLSVGASQDQFSFSIDPARPDAEKGSTQYLIRLRSSRNMKRVEMPSVVGLSFDSAGSLQFSEDISSFWLESRLLSDRQIETGLFYKTVDNTTSTLMVWQPVLMETPLQTADEFAMDNPFRELAETRWWGPDLLAQKINSENVIHRLEIGPPSNSKLIDCRVGEWLVFTGKNWEKCSSPDNTSEGPRLNRPLAHILTANNQFLEIEGWKEMSHLRFRMNLVSSPPLKIKTDELFSQLRVRSDKQVSCTMDKQCLVLRPGDWVLKSGGRWKTLRKFEEKESLLAGDASGEVFILEKIGVASSAKNIVGYYFSAGRTQVVPVEVAQRTQKGRKASR